MKKLHEIHITFLYPGILFSENSSEVLYSNSKELINFSKLIKDTLKKVLKRKNKNWFACYFVKSTKIIDGGESFTGGKNKQISSTYYPSAKKYSYKEMEVLNKSGKEGDLDILVSNMRNNHYTFVVKTRCGNYQPFDEKKDKII